LVGETGCGKTTVGRAALMLHEPTAVELIEGIFEDIDLAALEGERLRHMRQRIGIERALALSPDLVIYDEPISSLDVPIQAQEVNLLEELQEKLNLTYLFIARDLSVVRHISNRVAVMYLGKIMGLVDRNEIYLKPLHPSTQALMSVASVLDPDTQEQRHRIILQGVIPSPSHPSVECKFNTLCTAAWYLCLTLSQKLGEVRPSHRVAGHFAP
jgi:oligopeptide transport system ATP-binding protein